VRSRHPRQSSPRHIVSVSPPTARVAAVDDPGVCEACMWWCKSCSCLCLLMYRGTCHCTTRGFLPDSGGCCRRLRIMMKMHGLGDGAYFAVRLITQHCVSINLH
jgi:hypothetical protein